MNRALALPLLVASILGGCADRTGILVEVTSGDLVVPGDVDALRFEADSTSGRTIDRSFPLDGLWPHSLTLVPADEGDLRAELTVRVTGMREGSAVIRRVISRVRFEEGRTRLLSVELSRDCLGIECDGDLDCVAGMCVGAPDGGIDGGTGDAGASDAGVDSGMDAGVDGGGGDAGEDGGADAGVDAGGDAGPDAAVDGGSDAAVDAGTDAGTDAGASGTADHVVISEVSTGGSGSASDELVELYNPTSAAVSIAGLALQYRAAGGSSFVTRATVPAGATIGAHGFYLMASETYSRSVAPDLPNAWTTGLAGSGGHLRIVLGGSEIDRFAWGSAVEPEGSAQPALSDDTSHSYERKAASTSTAATMQPGGSDEDRGNGWDTDDNASDFVHRTPPDPQNASSAAETP